MRAFGPTGLCVLACIICEAQPKVFTAFGRSEGTATALSDVVTEFKVDASGSRQQSLSEGWDASFEFNFGREVSLGAKVESRARGSGSRKYLLVDQQHNVGLGDLLHHFFLGVGVLAKSFGRTLVLPPVHFNQPNYRPATVHEIEELRARCNTKEEWDKQKYEARSTQ
jgi:hypothetical protein